MERKIMIRDAKRYVSDHRWWIGGGTAGILAICSILAILLLRKKHSG